MQAFFASRRTRIGAALALAVLHACAWAGEHAAVKRPFNLPPPVDLHYSISARQKGFSLSGDALVKWRVADAKYSLVTDSRAVILGSILHNTSEGAIDAFGIAPALFHEKRFRQDPVTTTFDRKAGSIGFSASKLAYPIKGGEQDRTSVPWQLVAQVRAAPDKFTPGSEWSFFVAGRRDAEPWTFKVVKLERIRTGLGELDTLHLVKLPPPDSKDQQIDLWLAPAHQWYAAKLRFADGDGEFVEQTLDQVTPR